MNPFKNALLTSVHAKAYHKASVQRAVPFKPWLHLSIWTASAQSYRVVYQVSINRDGSSINWTQPKSVRY